MYERVSQGKALIPPAIGFLLDREYRSPEQQRDLKRRAKGKLRFLPQRMFECYLLHPRAIADLILHLREGYSPQSGELEVPSCDAQMVATWLEQAKEETTLYSDGQAPVFK